MRHYDVTKPIGLVSPCEEIERTCSEAHMYRRCGVRPKHFIVPLDAGSGRTTLIEYMTDKYKEAGVMDFTSGLDDYIEVVFDGTLQQLKQAFSAIDSAAVYTNEYCNIISMDISEISTHIGETQFTEFIKNCKRVCEHACVVFFVHSTPTRNEERLLDKLCEAVDNVRRLTVEPYSKNDMVSLIIKATAAHGIVCDTGDTFRHTLECLVTEFNISSVKDANAAAEYLVQFADFSGFTPVVGARSIQTMISSMNSTSERSDVK